MSAEVQSIAPAGSDHVAPSARRARHRPSSSVRVAALTLPLLLGGCARTLVMPLPDMVPTPAGPVLEVPPLADERASSRLGKIDTFTIRSSPDLVRYVEAELVNSLSRMGLTVRQVGRGAVSDRQKRLEAALLSAELSSDSTALKPVVATIRFRVDLLDETGRSTFRRDFFGAASEKLGFHTQGGPEDARLLAEAIGQAMERVAAERALRTAAFLSEAEAADARASVAAAASAPPRAEPPASDATTAVEERLSTLDQLLREGLIDRDDYETKRQEILDDL